ncbi:2-(3-amino-3-carboxypropyl)histidine synthase [Nematocida homosporus]|uniref:2-(3-amino-3-carboxypropyl)histidine synthase n=1 Tax=Nematocida homosporus TaxID=1912981 RepID=UPI00221E39B0|nr:2-(3-amino-3-carboxypropyl)histidine synthase [Nematocida homosporus]KAI5184989.1 2-(3-amino-3-carboxypropyl)histidine synthase [Nematocida homosporus]
MGRVIAGVEYLPVNYRFEIDKTLVQIRRRGSKRIALQFPEGIIHLATVISDIIRGASEVEEVVILSDVVYGACCLDDISAFLIGCDLLIHYGHSCLFEIPKSLLGVVYVFVEISFAVEHCVAMALQHLDCTDLSVLGTIQYSGAVRRIRRIIQETVQRRIGENRDKISENRNGMEGSSKECKNACSSEGVVVPRIMPLSPGEVLGCTSPAVKTGNLLFVAEGRFHLESTMIHNPHRKFFRYCPATKTLTEEKHDYTQFRTIRRQQQLKALECQQFLVIFGTLGRQGGQMILKRVLASLKAHNRAFTCAYLSEIDETFMDSVDKNTAIIEIACPRIAIDWGTTFEQPLLTPFEYFTLEQEVADYPMDYYARDGQEKPWRIYQSQ